MKKFGLFGEFGIFTDKKREKSERVVKTISFEEEKSQVDTSEAEFWYTYESAEEILMASESRGYILGTEWKKLCCLIEIIERKFDRPCFVYGLKCRLDKLELEWAYKREHPERTLI